MDAIALDWEGISEKCNRFHTLCKLDGIILATYPPSKREMLSIHLESRQNYPTMKIAFSIITFPSPSQSELPFEDIYTVQGQLKEKTMALLHLSFKSDLSLPLLIDWE